MSIIELVDAAQAFLSSKWGGGMILLVGLALELLFAAALFRWKTLAFVNAWMALVLALLLAISSNQHTAALILAIIVALNMIDVPLVMIVRVWFKRIESSKQGDSLTT